MIKSSTLSFKEVGICVQQVFLFFLFTVFINYLGQDVNSIFIKFVEAKWRGVFQNWLGHTILCMGAGTEWCSQSDENQHGS